MKSFESAMLKVGFLIGCIAIFLSIQTVNAQTYGEYKAELISWENCNTSHFSGGGDCGNKPQYQPCGINIHFSGGDCKPVKPSSCAVYNNGTLYINDVDIIVGNKLDTFNNIKLYWNGSDFSLIK